MYHAPSTTTATPSTQPLVHTHTHPKTQNTNKTHLVVLQSRVFARSMYAPAAAHVFWDQTHQVQFLKCAPAVPHVHHAV